MSFLLTERERDRFVAYLEREADAGDQLAVQMEKVGGPPMLTIAKLHRNESAAMRLIAKRLRETEFQSIGSEEGQS